MSIIRPQKLAIISGPGSEYLTGKIEKNLLKIYHQRYSKLSKVVMKKYGLSESEVIKRVSFIDDVGSKIIPNPEHIPQYKDPKLLINVKYTKFKNGEVKAEILEAIRGYHVYVIYDITNHTPLNFVGDDNQSLTINDHLFMLFTIVQALTLAGAETVTLVLPTYPYARQHKKNSREALAAAMVTRFFESLHVKRIITLDIHSKEIENACDTLHLENLHALYQNIVQLSKIIDISSDNLTVVAPDSGAISRNKFLASTLSRPLAMLYKERDYSIVSTDAKHSNIRSINLLGSVDGKDVIIADDMVSTGGTLLSAMRELKKLGAKRIICIVSLPYFDGDAVENFDKAYEEGVFYRIIGTNAVYHDKDFLSREWFVQSDVTPLFANVIHRLHHGFSITPLLDNRQFLQEFIESSRNENSDGMEVDT